MFVVFEGVEGSGKSTQACRVAGALGALLTKEPGGTPLGRDIREMLLHTGNKELAPTTEVLLYFADRAQHVSEVLRPALAAGKTVVSDRYVASSLAYQGYGRGLPLPLIRSVAELATGGLAPDITVFLDIPPDVGLARVRDRGVADRMETEKLAFYERVRAGYFALMEEAGTAWLRVDGGGDPQKVFADVMSALGSRGLRAVS